MNKLEQQKKQETLENSKDNRNKKKKQLVRIGLLVLLVLLLLLTLFQCSKDTGDSRVTQGIIDIPEGYDIQGEVDKAVEEGMFKIFINTNIKVNQDGNANLLIQNDAENHYPVYVTIQHNEDVLYKSDVIHPGYKLETDKLLIDLDPDTYDCTATFHVLDSDTLDEINSINCLIKITKEK